MGRKAVSLFTMMIIPEECGVYDKDFGAQSPEFGSQVCPLLAGQPQANAFNKNGSSKLTMQPSALDWEEGRHRSGPKKPQSLLALSSLSVKWEPTGTKCLRPRVRPWARGCSLHTPKGLRRHVLLYRALQLRKQGSRGCISGLDEPAVALWQG